MPKRKTSVKKTRIAKKLQTPMLSSIPETGTLDACCGVCKNPFPKKPTYIAVALVAVLFLVFAVSRGYVVAAITNGKPVFRFQLTNALISRYGKQTLESMISEQLIKDEAKKKNISVTQQEIDTKEEQILKSFGGDVTLDEVLSFQGMTKADFDNQIKVQILVTKLLGSSVTTTDDEVMSFIEKNRSFMTASEDAELQKEAKTSLIEQKINEQIQPWFTEIKNNAKIFRFL